MTNKKYNNINKSNTRFLYQENLKDYIKLFKTKEELKNFFNKQNKIKIIEEKRNEKDTVYIVFNGQTDIFKRNICEKNIKIFK